MDKKTPYEELLEKVNRLEEETRRRREVEKTLRDRDERFREMADNVREVFWLFDWIEQRVIYASPAYELIWDRSLETLYKQYDEWSGSIYPEDLAFAQESFARIAETGGGEIREYRIIRPDGTVRWISDRGFAVQDDNGQVVRIAGIAEDITDRKQIEEALRRSEEKHKTLTESSLTGVYIIQDDRFVFVNDRFAQILGYTTQEILSMGYLELIHPDERELVKGRVSQRLGGKDVPSPYEVRTLKKDGNVVWVEIMATLMQYGGKPAIMGNIIDMTDRKEAERALRESEKRYRALVEDMPALICRFLTDGTLTFVNSAYCDYFNKTREECIGHNFFQFIPEGDRKALKNQFKSLNKRKPMITYEHQVSAPDGTSRWQLWTDRALLDENDIVVEYQTMGRDITASKRAEEERERLIMELRNALAEVKTLSGLLPICASCKKIRDDRGYWNQIETYIRRHSNADFTHSLCPGCEKRLYEELHLEKG